MAATTLEHAHTDTDGLFEAAANATYRTPTWTSAAMPSSDDDRVNAWASINVTSGDSPSTSGDPPFLPRSLVTDDVMRALRARTNSTMTSSSSEGGAWVSGGEAYGVQEDEYSLHIEASRQLWDLVQQDETVVLVIFLSIVTCVGLVAVVVSKVALRRRHQYQLIPASEAQHRFSYIYRPVHGNAALDDEYENTFVGVSIPILQDNTRI